MRNRNAAAEMCVDHTMNVDERRGAGKVVSRMPDRYRLPAQRTVVALLDGRKEGVHVDMNDLADAGINHVAH